MTGGIPCANTYEKVLSILNPKKVETIFNDFIMSFLLDNHNQNDIIDIDRIVTIGRSRNEAVYHKNIKSLNVLNAYSNNYGICLESEQIDDKTNEISRYQKY